MRGMRTLNVCLKWNEFQLNAISAFVALREDTGFADVTLACEDGQQVEAHKVILASSSPFFLKLLRKNKPPHPLIYMRGVKSEGLKAILDFLYFGEANIPQDYLDAFFVLASELEIKGMTEEIFKKQPPWKNVIKEEKLNISALPKSLENNSHLPDETKVDSPVDSTEAYKSL